MLCCADQHAGGVQVQQPPTATLASGGCSLMFAESTVSGLTGGCLSHQRQRRSFLLF